MSNVWTESENLMKKMTFITQKFFFDDFPSGGGHVYAKNVKKRSKIKKRQISWKLVENFVLLTTYSKRQINF